MDPSPPEGRTTIDLKILSPSPEVGTGGLQLRNVAVNTTIGALKSAITDTIPSHPGPERQRLIYLGRALARDEEELQNIFGRDAVRFALRYKFRKKNCDANSHARRYKTMPTTHYTSF